jgi:hypothetical protein
LLEIVGLPLIGAAFIEIVHNRRNELVLFFVPFLVAVIRLFIAQFQLPPVTADTADFAASRAARWCIGINQLAIFVLIFAEVGAVIASSPDTPVMVWAAVAAIFLLYFVLRLWSRRYWMIAWHSPTQRMPNRAAVRPSDGSGARA